MRATQVVAGWKGGAGLGTIDYRYVRFVRPYLGSGQRHNLRQAPDVIDVVVGDDDPLDSPGAEIDLPEIGEKQTRAARKTGID